VCHAEIGGKNMKVVVFWCK